MMRMLIAHARRYAVYALRIAVAFAALLGLSCGLLFGALPAVHLSRIDPQRALRAGEVGAPRNRLREALMGVEAALALVVLVVAALFLKSFGEARTTDPGFRRETAAFGFIRVVELFMGLAGRLSHDGTKVMLLIANVNCERLLQLDPLHLQIPIRHRSMIALERLSCSAVRILDGMMRKTAPIPLRSI